LSNSTQPKPVVQTSAEPTLPKSEKALRNRPFLLVTIIRRPKSSTKTNQAGWTKIESNWESFEQPLLVDRINATHIRNANIIIDVINTKAVKNSFTSNTDEEVVEHYLNKYRQHVTQAMDVWLTQHAKNSVK
jgi:hypothetical protein